VKSSCAQRRKTELIIGINQVAITCQPAIEQLLVLLPEGIANLQAAGLAERNTKNPGASIDFNLNLNLPPACTTGFLPAQQMRTPNFEDAPDRPAGDLYCRIPQNSDIADLRGARNYPYMTRPGKRAPTVAMCESDEQYVPLNDGLNWKGDPNATLSGQDIPQLPPGSAPAHGIPAPGVGPPPPDTAPAPVAAAEYDPATGTYIGPDGHAYTVGSGSQRGQSAFMATDADSTHRKLTRRRDEETADSIPLRPLSRAGRISSADPA
jgi:phospholipid/cholesterol/gamma-HCH transport system substrate-binding protein